LTIHCRHRASAVPRSVRLLHITC